MTVDVMEDEGSSGPVVYQVADASSPSSCMKLDLTEIDFETLGLSQSSQVKLPAQQILRKFYYFTS